MTAFQTSGTYPSRWCRVHVHAACTQRCVRLCSCLQGPRVNLNWVATQHRPLFPREPWKRRGTSTQKCSAIESGSGYGKVVLPRMSKQPQRLWVYGVRKPKVVCLCAAMPMHGSAHCETMYNGRWTADRTHVAWVTCVEKGGQACITSYVCCPVLDNWLQKSNQIDWIIPMDGR